VFLGSTRDYVVEARDGTPLRITATPEQSFAPGTPVWVTLPKERCRALLS
jgi:iron(III) transport system ATP-binding protein